jgi:hypothetical protein
MWHVDKAVEESASFEQVGKHCWRSSLTGFISGSAEADTPSRSLSQLKEAVDLVLSSVVRRVGPFTGREDGGRAALAPQWEKLLTAEIARTAVSARRKAQAESPKPKVARKRR